MLHKTRKGPKSLKCRCSKVAQTEGEPFQLCDHCQVANEFRRRGVIKRFIRFCEARGIPVKIR